MEFSDWINPYQIVVLLVILVMLGLQYWAKARGLLVEIHYTPKQRLHHAILMGLIPAFTGILHDNFYFILLGVTVGIICYRRKQWYKVKFNR